MSSEVSRRDFLHGAEAVVLAAMLNRAYADIAPEDLAGDEEYWKKIRSTYARDPKLINLNNGGVAPAPNSVLEAEIEAIRYSNQLPAYRMWHDLEPGIEDVRKKMAQMWNADPECIAITRNASESLQIAQFGLDLQPGDEVLTTSQDYPRMITTWQQRERREKIVLKQLDFSVPVHNSADLVRMLEQGITPRTRVIHVSQVVFMTGQIFPVKEICALARSRGITSIVDGAHAFAHVPFQFSDMDCDFYGASLHKWLSAPIGTGMLYVRKDRIEKHWALMAAPPSMDKNIRKFEEIGTHPAAMHNATLQALEFHEQMGAERKFARFRYLKNRWAERLSKVRGAKVLVELGPNQSGAFGTIHFDGVDPSKLSDELLSKYNIFVVPIKGPGLDGIRVSANVYTSPEEIDQFCAAVEAIVPRA
ncbi:MAG TPA: aminotransferase class V-fold PLP-dependent enzyme [Candidatus Bathyarchaeia archaeon]|jgi:selenocysteine lyase/cysteine desulfurase|nr:aminotransferase class V-fold PLP-dependent enzyme [Candidatus Bathyarchaeia archaeon]